MGDAFSSVLNAAIYRRNRSAMDNTIRQQSQIATAEGDNAKTLSPYIGDFFSRAKDAYDPALSHYRALASGDRSQIMPAIAAQTRGIQDQYGSITAANRELAPRSGAAYSGNVDRAYQAGDAVQNIQNQEISGAYPNLAKMSGTAADIGSAAAGRATNAGQGASGIGNSSLMNRYGSMAGGAQAYGNLFKSFYDAYQSHLTNADTTAADGAAAGASGASGGAADAAGGADYSSACFFTTACTSAAGLPDHCDELQTLRRFRDQILLSSRSGKRLVKQYYRRAPQIVHKIDQRADRGAIWALVLSDVRSVVSLIKRGKVERAVSKYKKLFYRLSSMVTEN